MKDYKEYMNKITEKLKKLKDGKFVKIWRVLTSAVFITMLVVNTAIWCKEGCKKSPKTAYGEELTSQTFRFRTWQSNMTISNRSLFYSSTLSDTFTFYIIYSKTSNPRFSFNNVRSWITSTSTSTTPNINNSRNSVTSNDLRWTMSSPNSSNGSTFCLHIQNAPLSNNATNLTFVSLRYDLQPFNTSPYNSLFWDNQLSYTAVPYFTLYVVRYSYSFTYVTPNSPNNVMTIDLYYCNRFNTNIQSFMQGDFNGIIYNGDTGDDIDVSAIYQQGYNAGLNDANTNVDTVSYNRGYEKGKQDGYNEGASATLGDITPFRVISQGVSQFLAIEIFPNVRISLLLSVVFGFAMVVIIMRL